MRSGAAGLAGGELLHGGIFANIIKTTKCRSGIYLVTKNHHAAMQA
jgi:hypothetical protein